MKPGSSQLRKDARKSREHMAAGLEGRGRGGAGGNFSEGRSCRGGGSLELINPRQQRLVHGKGGALRTGGGSHQDLPEAGY